MQVSLNMWREKINIKEKLYLNIIFFLIQILLQIRKYGCGRIRILDIYSNCSPSEG